MTPHCRVTPRTLSPYTQACHAPRRDTTMSEIPLFIDICPYIFTINSRTAYFKTPGFPWIFRRHMLRKPVTSDARLQARLLRSARKIYDAAARQKARCRPAACARHAPFDIARCLISTPPRTSSPDVDDVYDERGATIRFMLLMRLLRRLMAPNAVILMLFRASANTTPLIPMSPRARSARAPYRRSLTPLIICRFCYRRLSTPTPAFHDTPRRTTRRPFAAHAKHIGAHGAKREKRAAQQILESAILTRLRYPSPQKSDECKEKKKIQEPSGIRP